MELPKVINSSVWTCKPTTEFIIYVYITGFVQSQEAVDEITSINGVTNLSLA